MGSILSFLFYFINTSGAFVDTDWGLSFVVPGLIIIGFGIIVWLFLIARPAGLLLMMFFDILKLSYAECKRKIGVENKHEV